MGKKLFIISCFLLFPFIVACGRRGDPIAIAPHKEVGVVEDLKAFIKDNHIYLTWGMPEGEGPSKRSLKGFAVFRAEVPERGTIEECDCQYKSLDFIEVHSKRNFEYVDKRVIKGQTYVYKLVVMDNDNRMGKDSNIVLVKGVKPEPQNAVVTPPIVPSGLKAVYTQKSIVLTWDEVPEHAITSYRIYRSEGKDFVAIGETVTSAFTDRDVEPSKKYLYRVTAVGNGESSPSKEYEIVTEVH